MPAVSAKQQRFMGACAHNPGSMKGKCPSKEVAEEFSHKPKGGYKKKPMNYGEMTREMRKHTK